MSKWGHVSTSQILQRFEEDRDLAAKDVSLMAAEIIALEEAVKEKDKRIMALQTNVIALASSEGQLKGYIARVRELDQLGQEDKAKGEAR